MMLGFFKRNSHSSATSRDSFSPCRTLPNVDFESFQQHKRDPCALQREKEAAKRGQIEHKFGSDTLELYDSWCRVAGAHFLFVYQKGSRTSVEVVEFYEPEVNRRGDLILEVIAPVIVKNHDANDPAELLEWDAEFELPISKLLYHEWIQEWVDDVEHYRQWIERGELRPIAKTG